MGAPPSPAGALHPTAMAWPLNAAVTLAGAPGSVTPVAQPWMLLLQSDCTGKTPVESETSVAAPWPLEIHAHLSASSSLPPSYHASRRGSVTASEYSCPATMVTPSR